MLSSVLNRKKEDFLKHVNELWNQYGEVHLSEFNRKIGDSDHSMIKFISQLSEQMYNERLAAKVDERNMIVGWQFWKNPEK